MAFRIWGQGIHVRVLIRGFCWGAEVTWRVADPLSLRGLVIVVRALGLSDTSFGFTLTLNNLPFQDLYKEIIIGSLIKR